MDVNRLKEVFLSTIDGDWYGLWEIDWSFNAAGAPADFRVRSGALELLVREGSIELRFGPLGAGDPIWGEQAIQAIVRQSNWKPSIERGQPVCYVGDWRPV